MTDQAYLTMLNAVLNFMQVCVLAYIGARYHSGPVKTPEDGRKP